MNHVISKHTKIRVPRKETDPEKKKFNIQIHILTFRSKDSLRFTSLILSVFFFGVV